MGHGDRATVVYTRGQVFRQVTGFRLLGWWPENGPKSYTPLLGGYTPLRRVADNVSETEQVFPPGGVRPTRRAE